MAAVATDRAGMEQLPVTWTPNEDVIEHSLHNDPDLQDIAAKLDTCVIIDPDRELNVDPSDSIPRDSDSASNSSSLQENGEEGEGHDNSHSDENSSPKATVKNGGPVQKQKAEEKKETVASNGSAKTPSSHQKDGQSGRRKSSLGGKSVVSETSSSRSKQGCSPTRRKNPLQMLKKLTKFDKPKKRPDYRSEFAAVVVDRLPQVFVAKYLGHRVVTGVSGLHHVRKPVDEMVSGVRNKIEQKQEVELPLLYVVVSPKGLDLREHRSNKVKEVAPLGMMPIDFISYGVQDIKYWRVFTCIVVRELSSRTRVATCHAFLCDSSHNGRKMALALGAAFSLYSQKLRTEGKVHNFQVELRPPDELADALDAECEA